MQTSRIDGQGKAGGATSRRAFLGAGAAVGAAALVSPHLVRAATGAATGPLAAQPQVDGFTETSVVTDELVINVRSIGSGDETIAIFPSLSRSSMDFDPAAYLLAAAGFHVVTIDPRGIGQTWTPEGALTGATLHTYAADMLDVINALELGQVHVLGHAFGNRVARVFAVDYPEVTKTVILCACGGGKASEKVIPIKSKGVAAVTNPATTPAEIAADVQETFFAPGNDATPWFTGWYPAGGKAEDVAIANTPFEEAEGGGDHPMLIIQGAEDIVAQPGVGYALKEMYGERVTVREIENAGHAMMTEHPDQVADLIIEYFGKPVGNSGGSGSGVSVGPQSGGSSPASPGGGTTVQHVTNPKTRRALKKARGKARKESRLVARLRKRLKVRH
jgi:pimeloyl-ACP methyl ester carboxylesterase